MSKIEAKPRKSSEIDLSMEIVTPLGETVKLKDIVDKYVQEKLEKIRKRIPTGKRNLAMKECCKLLFRKGSIADTKKELAEIANKVSKDVGIRFTYNNLLRNQLVIPVKREVEDKITGRKFLVRFYVLSPKKYQEMFGEKLTPEIATAPTEVKPEAPETEIEKAIEEATK